MYTVKSELPIDRIIRMHRNRKARQEKLAKEMAAQMKIKPLAVPHRIGPGKRSVMKGHDKWLKTLAKKDPSAYVAYTKQQQKFREDWENNKVSRLLEKRNGSQSNREAGAKGARGGRLSRAGRGHKG